MKRVCVSSLRMSARSALRQRVGAAGMAVCHLSNDASVYAHGKFRSDAEARIAAVKPIEVDGYEAICDGGGGMLGHPIEYIDLDIVTHNRPAVCKYCGLRYVKKAGAKAHH